LSDTLPDKIVHIDVLRINHAVGKRCKCKVRGFVVDEENKEVTCNKCGARVDPFEAMADLATHYDKLGKQVDELYAQRKQLSEYKPHLLVVRELEKRYRGKTELPTCPHCRRGFYIEEITHWTNRRFEEHRRFEEQQESEAKAKGLK